MTRRIVTLNVNSLTAALGREGRRLLEFIDKNRGHVIALQETMVDPKRTLRGNKWRITPFIRRVKQLGYHVIWHSATRGNGGYGGTMFLTLTEPEHVVIGTGDIGVDTEGRFMAMVFEDAIVINTYVPTLSLDLSGQDRKDKFWKAAEARYRTILADHPNRPAVW